LSVNKKHVCEIWPVLFIVQGQSIWIFVHIVNLLIYRYLYTIGQILDHCADLGALWKKELRLIYLTPDGGNVFPNKPTKMNKQNQTEAEQEWKELMSGWGALYRGPQSLQDPKGVNSSISLREAVQKLQPEPGDEEFVALLQSIVKSIYDTEEILPCQT